jgi:hypothetical protein
MAHPISRVTILGDRTPDTKLEIIRENIPGGDWHNRYVQNAETKVTSYSLWLI